jgi:RimJ/RimL family protein N-acetyltransferase
LIVGAPGPAVGVELLRSSHARPLFELLRDHGDALSTTQPWARDLRSLEAVTSAVEATLDAVAAGERVSLVVTLDGAPVGMAGLEDIDRAARRASIGLWIVPPAQRRGAGTHAVRALLARAIDELRLDRIDYVTAVDNAPSVAFAEALGLRPAERDDEGTRTFTWSAREQRAGGPREGVRTRGDAGTPSGGRCGCGLRGGRA